MKNISLILVVLTACLLSANAVIRDNINLPFINDEQVIGTWDSVDFVTNIIDFVPSQKQFQGDLAIKSIAFLKDGKTPDEWWTWTKGVLIHKYDETASHYEIRNLSGSDFMFLEWKSGDYRDKGMKPKYYVLKKK